MTEIEKAVLAAYTAAEPHGLSAEELVAAVPAYPPEALYTAARKLDKMGRLIVMKEPTAPIRPKPRFDAADAFLHVATRVAVVEAKVALLLRSLVQRVPQPEAEGSGI